MTVESNKEVVRRYFEHFAKQEITEALALLSDDLCWWILGKPHLYPYGGTKTKAEIADIFATIGSLLPEWVKVEQHNVTAEGDRVAVEWESRGIAKNGKQYNNNFFFLFVIRDEKIVAVREYFDLMHVLDIFHPEPLNPDAAS